jgi:hypothetical protein
MDYDQNSSFGETGMNIREGMRRLGILIGAAGGILGGFFASTDAQTVWSAFRANRKFESLMATPTMQKVIADPFARFGGWPTASENPNAKDKQAASAPTDPDQFMAQRRAARVKSLPPPPPGYKLDPPHRPDGASTPPSAESGQASESPDDWQSVFEGDGTGGIYLLEAHPLLKGNPDGIAKIQFDDGQRVTSIELSTGESAHRTDAPKASACLMLFAYPVLGFLLPWGGVRVLTWAGSGFFEPPR